MGAVVVYFGKDPMRGLVIFVFGIALYLGFTRLALAVDLVCSWAPYGSEKETFVIELKDSKAYWVNQDQNMKVVKINSGLVIINGKRDSIRVADGKWLQNVDMTFVIDRISGAVTIALKGVKKEYDGKCIVQRVF